jgi:hypothetical protein
MTQRSSQSTTSVFRQAWAPRFLFVLLLGLGMTARSVSQHEIAASLFSTYDEFKVQDISTRTFTQRQLAGWIGGLETRGAFRSERAGTSAEGRDILLLTVGSGPTAVFLWSQMHGDEPTATMAIIDMLSFFSLFPDHPVAQIITERLTVSMMPMINPDGAERFQRRTAQLVDINRDALTLRTPEARLLKATRERLSPRFGFNLHDQSPRYSVGSSRKVAAIGLLAPALDEEKSDPPVREDAKHVAAALVNILGTFIPGHIARYDDTFEPRAFGDNIQKWGTSTVLIESGGWAGDPEKMFLRKLNTVALLSVLYEIATGQYQNAQIASYEDLPFNRERFYDLIVRGASVRTNGLVPPIVTDVGINFESSGRTRRPADSTYARIVDIGDLHTFGSFEEISGKGIELDSTVVRLDRRMLKSQLLQMIRGN